MVSTCKKRQSKRRLVSQLDDFDQDIIIGNTVRDRQENATVNEGTGDQEFTVANLGNYLTASGNAVKTETLERCFNGRIDREMSNIIDTVEHKRHF